MVAELNQSIIEGGNDKAILLRAAAIMREGGLVRGVRYANGQHCLLGAIVDAIQPDAKGWLRWAPSNNDIGKARQNEDRLTNIVASCIRDASPSESDTYNGNGYIEINRNPSLKCAWWSNMIAKDAEEVALKFEEAAMKAQSMVEA